MVSGSSIVVLSTAIGGIALGNFTSSVPNNKTFISASHLSLLQCQNLLTIRAQSWHPILVGNVELSVLSGVGGSVFLDASSSDNTVTFTGNYSSVAGLRVDSLGTVVLADSLHMSTGPLTLNILSTVAAGMSVGDDVTLEADGSLQLACANTLPYDAFSRTSRVQILLTTANSAQSFRGCHLALALTC